MSEPLDEAQLRKAMDRLRGASDRAWRRRRCLPAAHFWQVALELGTYPPAEQRHLAECPACQKREREIRSAVRPAAVAGSAGALLAEQPLRVPTEASRKSARPRAQQLTFSMDPQLTARLVCDDRAGAVLDLEHSSWPPATLVHVMVAATDSTPCGRWLAPCCAKGRRVTARVRLPLESPAEGGSCYLRVQPVAPSQLTDEDLPLLHDALARAAGDADACASWQQWAGAICRADEVAESVRRAAAEGVRRLATRPGLHGR